jgi:hypothetical protein
MDQQGQQTLTNSKDGPEPMDILMSDHDMDYK